MSGAELGHKLVQDFHLGKIHQKQIKDLLLFLLNTRQLKSLIEVYVELLKDKQKPFFPPLLASLFWSEVRRDKKLVQDILEDSISAALSLGTQNELLEIKELFHLPAVREIREKLSQSLSIKLQKQRDQLFEKLKFFRAQGIIEEERRVLALIERSYPDDPELWQIRTSFKERWAQHILNRPRPSRTIHLPRRPTRSSDELKFVSFVSVELKKLIRAHPSNAYDAALCLLFMEAYTEALDVLGFHTMNQASDWLRLELHLMSGQYLNALEDCRQVEIRYSDQPETAFAASYGRAQALYGLGKTSEAIEVLSSLLRVRPSYRSAGSLLLKWEGELL